MRGSWAAIPRRILREPYFRALGPFPPTPPALYLALRIIGPPLSPAFAVRVSMLAEDLGWDAGEVTSSLTSLHASGAVVWDASAGVVLLVHALEDDPPTGPSQRKRAETALDDLPDCEPVRRARSHLGFPILNAGEHPPPHPVIHPAVHCLTDSQSDLPESLARAGAGPGRVIGSGSDQDCEPRANQPTVTDLETALASCEHLRAEVARAGQEDVGDHVRRLAGKLRADQLAIGYGNDRMLAALTASLDALDVDRLNPDAPTRGAAGFVVQKTRALAKPGALEAHRARFAPKATGWHPGNGNGADAGIDADHEIAEMERTVRDERERRARPPPEDASNGREKMRALAAEFAAKGRPF